MKLLNKNQILKLMKDYNLEYNHVIDEEFNELYQQFNQKLK